MSTTIYLTIRVPRELLKAFQDACARGAISVNPGECKPTTMSRLLRRRMREHLNRFLPGRRIRTRRRNAVDEAQALINRAVLPPPGAVFVESDESEQLLQAGSLAGTGEGYQRGRDTVALTIRVEPELLAAFGEVCQQRGKTVSRVLRDIMRQIVGADRIVEQAFGMGSISRRSPLYRRLRALQKRKLAIDEARLEAERERLEREAREEWRRSRS